MTEETPQKASTPPIFHLFLSLVKSWAALAAEEESDEEEDQPQHLNQPQKQEEE